jgi:ribosomal protein L7/L12
MVETVPFVLLAGIIFIFLVLMGISARLQVVERKLTVLLRCMRIDADQVVPLSARVKELALAGDKIGAIKQHRDETGAGLKEAKDAVEEYLAARG